MVDQVRTAVSTAASGTFDITVSGQTETPVAALFYVTYATTDDTIASDAVFGWGATDGTGEFCQTVKSEDAQTTSDTDRIQSTTACLGIHDPGGSWDGQFSYNSFITGGIRLDIDDQAPSGFLVTAIFFYSADVSDVAIITPGLGSTTSPVNNTSVGFELDVMFMGHIYTSSTSNNVHAPLSLGVVYNDVSATPTQKSMAMCADNGSVAGGDQNTFIDNSSGLCATLLGSKRWELTISDIDSTGFTHTCTASTSTVMYCLCLKLETGVSFDLFDLNFPTSGNYAETNPGFEPDFGSIFSMVGPTGYNSFSAGTANVGWSVATFDGTNIYTNNFTDSDGDDPTICKSLSSDQLRILDSDGSTDAVIASSYAFDADGWDFTLSTNPSATVYGFGWAFKGAGGGGATEEAAASFGCSLSGTALAGSTATSNISVAISTGSTAPASADSQAPITASASLGFASTNTISIESFAAFSVSSNASIVASAVASANAVVSVGLQAAPSVVVVAESSITLAPSLGVVATGQAVTAGSIEADIVSVVALSANAAAQALAESQVAIDVELASSVIAQATAAAGITIAQVLGMSCDGSTLSGDIVTPDGRKCTVSANLRACSIPGSARNITIN